MRAAAAWFLAALALAPAPAGASRAGTRHELLVHAASSLKDALSEIGALHASRTGVAVRLDLGGSNALARQLIAGAPGDLFFSADEARMDEVEEAGLLAPDTRVSLLSNSLVVIVAADSAFRLGGSADLAGPAIGSVALADPGSVPAGRYAREHLRRIGAWERVEPKVVPTENVRAALAAVESGNVDAGIVYATDARSSTRVRVAAGIPSDTVPGISYPVAVLAGSRDPAAARALLAFLRGEEAAGIFAKHGFVVRR